MATTQRPENHRPRTDLTRGFDYLTLDPAPRLRALRKRQKRHDPFTEAWRMVAVAISEALQTVAKRSSTR